VLPTSVFFTHGLADINVDSLVCLVAGECLELNAEDCCSAWWGDWGSVGLSSSEQES